MRRHPFVIILIVGTLVAGAFLAFYLHQEVKKQVLSQFRETQLQMARQAAEQIESYVEARTQDARHAALLASVQHLDLESMPRDVEARFASLKTRHVDEVAVVDAVGTLVYSTTRSAVGSDYAGSDVYTWAREPANRENVKLTMETLDARPASSTPGRASGRSRLSIATPVYQPSAAGDGSSAPATFAGVLLLKVDLQSLVERALLLAPVARQASPLSIWAMDADGTVLLQSEHPEMVSRNIRARDGTCRQCHVSFDYAERMLTVKQGAADYQLKGRDSKVAAFAPVNFGPLSWIVVVNAPKDLVTGFIQVNFLETMGLLGMVALVLGVAFFFVNRSSRQETVIAEKARHLAEKERLVEELREAGEYLENLFDSASAPVVVWDADLRITRFNRACEQLTGFSAASMIGQDLRRLFPEENREESLTRILPAANGDVQPSPEIPIRRQDGEVRIVLWNSAHIRHGPEAVVIATIAQGQDITERRRAEESLRAADDQLREQAALVRLGEMAAVVAHEVKNPLAGIRGTIQVIAGRLPPGTREVTILGDVIARIDALDDLMKDLLLFARPPQMHPAPVDLVALAKETTALVSQDPAARDVRFEVDGSAPLVSGDAKLLRIVFLNLIVNATHALRNTGTIRAFVTADERTCQVTIADTGPGIPPEIRDRIFVPFFTTKTRGTGLGLSTAKRLIDAHHGRISVDCPAGGGTVVAVELPRELAAQHAART